MLKGLSIQTPMTSQTSMVSYSHCQALNHTLSSCSYFAYHYLLDKSECVWPIKDLKMIHSPLTITHDGEITLTFFEVVDQML